MTDLADLTVGALVRGILDRPVRIVQLEWHGSDALTLTYTDESGRPGQAGKVRLLDRQELPTDWNPVSDRRLTVWEATQHLIRMLDIGGEARSADLLRQVGTGLGETARELAYRLYMLCERKNWTKEALAYNGLVVSWPEIVRLAAEETMEAPGQQTLV